MTGPSKAELVERIRALELLLQNPNRDAHTQPSSYLGSPSQSDPHSLATEHKTKTSPSIENLDSDVAWLSSIYDGTRRAVSTTKLLMKVTDIYQLDDLPTDKVIFRICPSKNIVETSKNAVMEEPSSEQAWPRRIFWIPPYSEAKILFEKFWEHVEYIHHIFHSPSLSAMLERIYYQLSQKAYVKSGEMVLLLSIFASATRAWTDHDSRERDLFATAAEAHSYAGFWVDMAEDMLDIARRTTLVSIEGVQATVVLLFVPENVEAFWRRCRSLHIMGVSLARELGLHCIDLPSKSHLANTIQAEVGRRVWWHLVASDW
jgi:hypothetical protein